MTRRQFTFAAMAQTAGLRVETEQITHGPKHHFYGYIGHVGNTPWSGDGRHLVALRTAFQERMPRPGEPADIVLLDPARGYGVEKIDETRAWNFQQGTMLYWNPEAPAREFFFNDRDPKTHRVFIVRYDVARRRRVREYRLEDTPFGNGGIAQPGGWLAGINYGRMARLRRVTGYEGAYDWTGGEGNPASDGVFRMNIATGKAELLVAFRQLASLVKTDSPLFINHTLWNRDGTRLYFYARANFDDRARRVNVPFTMNPDGTRLTPLKTFIGGHPEWERGTRMLGEVEGRQVVYDTDRQAVVEQLGTSDILPSPGADIALSPDGEWLVNGYGSQSRNYYVFLRRRDGAWARSQGFSNKGWETGDLRNDPAPCWKRDSREIVFPAIAADGTRQMHRARIVGA